MDDKAKLEFLLAKFEEVNNLLFDKGPFDPDHVEHIVTCHKDSIVAGYKYGYATLQKIEDIYQEMQQVLYPHLYES
jgi:hypothetical protein